MLSHAQCTHGKTPRARRACRMVRPVLAYAEKLGLVVESVGEDPLVPQYVIHTQADWEYHPKLLITSGYGTPRVSWREATGNWKDDTWGPHGRHVGIWLQMMKEDDVRHIARMKEGTS